MGLLTLRLSISWQNIAFHHGCRQGKRAPQSKFMRFPYQKNGCVGIVSMIIPYRRWRHPDDEAGAPNAITAMRVRSKHEAPGLGSIPLDDWIKAHRLGFKPTKTSESPADSCLG